MRILLFLCLLPIAAVAQVNYIMNPFTGSPDATMTGTGGGTVTNVSGTGTVSGISLVGTVTGSGNLTLGGTLSVGPTELQSTAVTPGSYTATDITVDADGRITAASNGSGGAPSAASYITKTSDGTLSAEFALGSLATGLLEVAATTGELTSIASSGTGNVARVASPTFTGTAGAANITATGTVAAGAASPFSFTGRSRITSASDGVLMLSNDAATSFTRLQFGGTTSSFPAIRRTTTALNFRLADDSADAAITAAAGTFTGLVTASGTLTVGNGATSSGVLRIIEDTDTGSMFASFQVPTLAANTVYILPPDDGNSGDVLRSDGSGTLTWVAQSGGAPTSATYITQTPDGTLAAEQALSGLLSGIMRVATTTGAITSLTTSTDIFDNISNETGSGALVGSTSPTLVTPALGVASATSINKVAVTAPATSATLTIADGKTLTASNTLTFTGTDASSVAFGTGGTATYTANNLSVFAATTSAQLAGVVSNETGTGVFVLDTSPSFTTQITSPKVVWTGAVQDLTGAGSPEGAITAAVGSVYRRTDGGAATTVYAKESGAGNTGWVAYGSPAGSGAPTTATYITQTPDGTLEAEQALSILSTGIMRVAATTGAVTSLTDSAGIFANISDETGSGLLVGATSPTLVTPVLGVASATTINKVALTAPATGSTLTIAEGKTLTASNTLTFTGTDASSVAFGAGGTVIFTSNNLGAHAATTSAQLIGVLSDETGSGGAVFATSPTITTPSIASPSITGSLTLTNGYLYTAEAMPALAIDTAELKNTKSVAVDSTLTFSAEPATGVLFGLHITNSDSVAHTITIPSSFSDGLGAARTTFVLAASSSARIQWQHDGGGAYTMYGEPIRVVDLISATPAEEDSFEFYDATDGLSKQNTLAGIGSLFVADAINNGTTTIAPAQNVVFDQLALKAPLASPTLTGNPIVPTPSADDNDTSAASTAYVQSELTAYASDTVTFSNKTLTAPKYADLGFIADSSGNELLIFDLVASAVNEVTLANAATGVNPKISATGGDTNIGLDFQGKGTGVYRFLGTATTSGVIRFLEDTDFGTNYVSLSCPSDVGAANVDLTLPVATDTLVGKTTTDVFQNKDLTNANNTLPCRFQIAASDMTTAITSGTNKAYFRAPHAFTLTSVRISAFTAPTGATILVDVNETGTTVLSTKIMIDVSEKTSQTAATAAVISDSAIADDAEITIDFDQVGSTVAGAGIIVTLQGTY